MCPRYHKTVRARKKPKEQEVRFAGYWWKWQRRDDERKNLICIILFTAEAATNPEDELLVLHYLN